LPNEGIPMLPSKTMNGFAADNLSSLTARIRPTRPRRKVFPGGYSAFGLESRLMLTTINSGDVVVALSAQFNMYTYAFETPSQLYLTIAGSTNPTELSVQQPYGNTTYYDSITIESSNQILVHAGDLETTGGVAGVAPQAEGEFLLNLDDGSCTTVYLDQDLTASFPTDPDIGGIGAYVTAVAPPSISSGDTSGAAGPPGPAGPQGPPGPAGDGSSDDTISNLQDQITSLSDELTTVENSVAGGISQLNQEYSDQQATNQDLYNEIGDAASANANQSVLFKNELQTQLDQQRYSAQQQNQYNKWSAGLTGAAAVAGGIAALAAAPEIATAAAVIAAGAAAEAAWASYLGTEPVDPNFTQIAQPQVESPAAMTDQGGVSPAIVTSSNALISDYAEIDALGTAISVSINRAQGAANANNDYWENAQVQAGNTYTEELGVAYGKLPALDSAYVNALNAAGINTDLTPAQVAAFAQSVTAGGVPASINSAMAQFGADPTIIALADSLIVSHAQQLAASGVSASLFDAADAQAETGLSTALADGMLTPFQGQLSPASDTGPSQTDGITNVDQPTFTGQGPAGYLVTVYAQASGQPGIITLGQATVQSDGMWSVTSSVLPQGKYAVIAQATDPSGATTLDRALGNLVVDETGPTITSEVYNPATHQLSVTLEDSGSGLDPASLADISTFASHSLAGGARRPAFVTKSITAASTTQTGDSETVALDLHRGGFSSRTLNALDAALSQVNDMAGNSLEDPNLRILPRMARSAPAGHTLAAHRKPTAASASRRHRHS
jgi:hypothetical protein